MQLDQLWKRAKRMAALCICSALPIPFFVFASSPWDVAHAKPARLASVNLCADQLLLALADRDQIAAVGPFAANPRMSFLSGKAKGLPSIRGRAEEFIRLQASLVLTGAFDSRFSRALLQANGMAVRVLRPWTSFDQGLAQIRTVGKLTGNPERAAQLVQEIEKELHLLRGLSLAGKDRSALVLHRRGYVLHAGVIGELLSIAGIRNAVAGAGLRGDGTISLEQIVRHRPDFLVVEGRHVSPEDQGQALLVHPALERLYPAGRRLILPQRLTVCAGPSTPALVRRFREELLRALKATR